MINFINSKVQKIDYYFFTKFTLKIGTYAYICTHKVADMAKLVDVPDLGSGAARRVGSSPITRTKSSNESWGFFYFKITTFI